MDEHQNQPQEPTQPEQEGQPDAVDPRALNALMHDVEEYDAQFSMGAMMARMVMGHLHEQQATEVGQEAPGAAELLASESDTQSFTAVGLMAIHRKTLAALGLSLEPVEGKTMVMMAEGAQAGSGELRVNISDSNRFLGFLSSLTPETVHETDTDHSLAQLADVLSQQVIDHYDLAEPSPQATELLDRLGIISSEYQRLGITGYGVDRFATYLTHSRAGDLREYVHITRQGLMQIPGEGFGPAEWQMDSTPESLAHRWAAALEVYEYARRNPRAGELYAALHTQLTNCVALALQDVRDHPDRYAYQSADGTVISDGSRVTQAMTAILEHAQRRLQRPEQQSPDQQPAE